MPAILQQTAGGLWAEQPAGAVLDYSFDWQIPGDDITASVWTASPTTAPPLTITNQGQEGDRTYATLSGGVPGQWYAVTNTVTTAAGRTDAQSFMLRIAAGLPATGSGLFPFPPAAVAEMRRDRLTKLALSIPAASAITLTDEELWTKLQAAEGEAERMLRTWLAPREVIPNHQAYDAEAAQAVADGHKVHREPGYDWGPDMVRGDKWGMIEFRHRPVQLIRWARLSYPTPISGVAELPPDWFRIDSKPGTAQIVWNSSPNAFALNTFLLSALSAGRTVPFMMHLRYRAGIEDPRSAYPDLAGLVQRLAVINLVEDFILPQSGSISADGLSRSISMQVDQHREAVETKLGKMREAIGGIRFIMV